MIRSLSRLLGLLLLMGPVACNSPPKGTEIRPHPTSTNALLNGTPEHAESLSSNGKVAAIQDMLVARAAHTATLLPDGQVLIAGGFNRSENALSSAEILDPDSGQFYRTGSMSSPRQSHTATLLPSGSVLIVGGYGADGTYLDRAELYDPVTAEFLPIGTMTTPRAGHTAVLLNDGKVLLAGGVTSGWVFLESAELYDPNTNSFSPTGNMTTARESHTATVLRNGMVLITGGHRGRRSSIVIYASAELYDPASGRFTSTEDMQTRRHKHDAVRLDNGRVLVLGGSDERDDDGQYSSVELFDPNTGSFEAVGEMNAPRYKFQGTSIQLRTGKVLLMGGARISEVYDPVTNQFNWVGDLGTARLFATTTLLPDGRVVLAGGYGLHSPASANCWVFQP